MASLPYITAPGNIERALNGIKSAETPERVTLDFVKTILKIKGGSGNQVASYLKKIGFVNSDGTPSPIYSRFRNASTSGAAALEAIKHGYAPLFKRNEFMHKLDDKELKGLIIEETGEREDSTVAGLILSSINALRKYVKDAHGKPEDADSSTKRKKPLTDQHDESRGDSSIGMNLSYTINLNLPPTTDIAVFNAIFKSLKEHLLRNSGGQ
jgi:hypothetical protein